MLPYKDIKIQEWWLTLRAYSVLEICHVYHTKTQQFKAGRWRYKLTVSIENCKVYHRKVQKYKGGHWRYKLTLSLKFVRSTIQTHPRTQQFKGGHWRYKLTVSLKIAYATIQRHKNSRVDVGVTNLQYDWNLQSLTYKDTKIKAGRWLSKLTVSMKFAKSTIPRYNKLKGGRWYCKLKVSLKFEKVHHTKTQKKKEQKNKGGRSRCRLTVC